MRKVLFSMVLAVMMLVALFVAGCYTEHVTFNGSHEFNVTFIYDPGTPTYHYSTDYENVTFAQLDELGINDITGINIR